MSLLAPVTVPPAAVVDLDPKADPGWERLGVRVNGEVVYSPVVDDDGKCDGNERPHTDGHAAAFCPKGDWPTPPVRLSLGTSLAGGRLPADAIAGLAADLAPIEQVWRASLPPGDVRPVGRLVAGDVTCAIGDGWTLPDCAVSVPRGTLELFPASAWGSSATSPLVLVDVPFDVEPAPAPPEGEASGAAPGGPAPTAPHPGGTVNFEHLLLAGSAALNLALLGSLGVNATRRKAPTAKKAPDEPLRTPPAPPDEAPAPQVDAIERQARLVADHPALRTALDPLLAPDAGAHRDRVNRLLDLSDALRATVELPTGWLERWDEEATALRDGWERLGLVLRSLDAAPSPSTLPRDAAHREAWRRLMPDAEGPVTDGGAALAAQLRLDLVQQLVVPWVRLAQRVTELLPAEAGVAVDTDLRAEDAAPLAAGLGYAYEHVAPWKAMDADYMLARDVGLSGVDEAAVLQGLPRPEGARAGVVVRVPQPILRPRTSDVRGLRGHLLVLKEA